MTMEITFPGGARVDAQFNGMRIATDQRPPGGGNGSAPEPFTLFLASIGTCAGIYVLNFCNQRGIPTDGLRLRQDHEVDRTTGMVKRIELTIDLPADFPEKYVPSVIRSAELCAVKKHLMDAPKIDILANGAAEPVAR